MLAALGLDVRDLFDEPRWSPIAGKMRPRPVKPTRPKTRIDRALDQLLSLPDFGERVGRAIAWQQAELSRPEHWFWRAAQFHQAGCSDIARACLRHASFLAFCAGQPLEDPAVTG